MEIDMNDSTSTLSHPTIPLDVRDFAADKQIDGYLSSVIDLAQHAFPASDLCVSLAQDAEDETHRYIALDVMAASRSTDELLAGQRIWSSEVTRVCPSRYAVYFVLGWK